MFVIGVQLSLRERSLATRNRLEVEPETIERSLSHAWRTLIEGE